MAQKISANQPANAIHTHAYDRPNKRKVKHKNKGRKEEEARKEKKHHTSSSLVTNVRMMMTRPRLQSILGRTPPLPPTPAPRRDGWRCRGLRVSLYSSASCNFRMNASAPSSTGRNHLPASLVCTLSTRLQTYGALG